MDWTLLLDAEDQVEFEKLLAGRRASPEFEAFFNRSQVLQELFEDCMRNDEIGTLLSSLRKRKHP